MLEYASFTAIGSREENQDRFLVLANEADGIYWFAVADGMGGHRCGGQAAEVAIAVDVAGARAPEAQRLLDKCARTIAQ